MTDLKKKNYYNNNIIKEEVILVSVGYSHNYDYTNIRVRDLVEKPGDYLHFICDNLMPYLVEQYSVDKQLLTLTGHSYSGYWAFYSLFHSDINRTKK